MLSAPTQVLLKRTIDTLIESEIVIESQRQHLAKLKLFAPYSVFCRLDRNASETLTSHELLDFMKE
jgi:hypothetical protein